MSCQRLGCRVPGALVCGKLVDEEQRRAASERRVEIEFVDVGSIDIELERRKLRQALQQRGGVLPPMRLQQADDHVHAARAQRMCCGQHRVCLADAGRSAEKNLQPAAFFALGGGIDVREQLVRIRSLSLHGLREHAPLNVD